jgi:hypothetical protein
MKSLMRMRSYSCCLILVVVLRSFPSLSVLSRVASIQSGRSASLYWCSSPQAMVPRLMGEDAARRTSTSGASAVGKELMKTGSADMEDSSPAMKAFQVW